jgi:hypothetical protein
LTTKGRVSKTYTYQKGTILPKSALGLPQTVILNIEAVVLECTSFKGFRVGNENRFFEALKSKTVDFISTPQIPDDAITVARACTIANKLTFQLSPRLKNWCKQKVEQLGINQITTLAQTHYRTTKPEAIAAQIQEATK